MFGASRQRVGEVRVQIKHQQSGAHADQDKNARFL